jgi:hypothetical protein
MMRLIKANESTAARRRVYMHLVDATDGMTPELGEVGGQPQVSVNGGAWTNTGIGVLVSIGNGRYYAELTQALVANAGDVIEVRYKSAETAEGVGDQVVVLGYDIAALPSALAGAGLRAVTLRLLDDQPTPAPVGNARVQVLAGGTLLFEVTTDAATGEATCSLDDGAYSLRISAPPGYGAPASPTLTVAGDGAHEYALAKYVTPTATDPALCRVSGRLLDASGAALASTVVQFLAVTPQVVGSDTMTRGAITATSDTGGQFYVDLVRGAQVRVVCAAAGLGSTTVRTVPDAPAQDFEAWA